MPLAEVRLDPGKPDGGEVLAAQAKPESARIAYDHAEIVDPERLCLRVAGRLGARPIE